MDRARQLRRRIRVLLTFFVCCLVLSGLTAFPLGAELRVLSSVLGIDESVSPSTYTGLQYWIAFVAQGIRETYSRYPFMGYGTDWLAFGYIVIAVMFIGPLRDPIRNVWVVTAGMIACVGVIPLAMIAGEIRGIPFYWRLIDCSFGVIGFIPLWLCRRSIRALEAIG
jgi:hypothetical protein